MPQVYDAPIGATQSGAPLPAKWLEKGSLIGNSMTGIPIPSITGGAAAPSGANAQTGANFIYANSGNTGAWLFISIAAVIALVVWKKKTK